MKLFSFAIAALFVASVYGAAIEELPVSGRLSDAARRRIRDQIRAAGGCNVNICFAIDGSGSINSTEFNNEKNFVLDVTTVIGVDEPVEFAAVQYSTGNSPISPLTPVTSEFILDVNNNKQLGGQSFVVGGLNYCFSQLARRRGEANKIVLLGDGRSNIGSSAIARADLFRRTGGEVCVVGAGFTDDEELLAIAGGESERVFEVNNFLDVLTLERIAEELTVAICVE